LAPLKILYKDHWDMMIVLTLFFGQRRISLPLKSHPVRWERRLKNE
jgi:hypothetical protein